MLGHELAYVALVARDAEAPAAVFERLGLTRRGLDDANGGTIAAFAAGRTLVALFPLGHPFVGGAAREGVHHIAFAAPDLARSASLASQAGVTVASGRPAAGLAGRRRIELGGIPLCGVRTWLTEPLDVRPETSSAVERIDHIGVASADNVAAVAAWSGRLGCPLESQQTDIEVMIPVESFTSDKHGVVQHARAPVPVGGLRVSFVTIGDTELEFLENFDPRHPAFVDRGSAGTTRQDQGAIARYIAKRGAGLHHLSFKTPDINAVLADLDRAGVPLIDRRGRPGSRASLIGFIDPAGMGGILVHFNQRPAHP